MAELTHALLLDAILTVPTEEEYNRQLRVWPLPPGWERLMSPLHHLRSYSLAAHARWSVIAPALFRAWLHPYHGSSYFMSTAQVIISPRKDG